MPEHPVPTPDPLDSGWLMLVKGFFKDKRSHMYYHIAREQLYRRCAFSYHERKSRKARLGALLDMEEHVERVRARRCVIPPRGIQDT